MFIRWECGCVGIQLTNECIVIASCDSDTDDLVFTTSKISVGEKPYVELLTAEKEELLAKLRRQLWDGAKFQQVKQLLKN